MKKEAKRKGASFQRFCRLSGKFSNPSSVQTTTNIVRFYRTPTHPIVWVFSTRPLWPPRPAAWPRTPSGCGRPLRPRLRQGSQPGSRGSHAIGIDYNRFAILYGFFLGCQVVSVLLKTAVAEFQNSALLSLHGIYIFSLLIASELPPCLLFVDLQ